MFVANLSLEAVSFSAVHNNKRIYYTIISDPDSYMVKVTYREQDLRPFYEPYSGVITIPDSVLYNDNYYKVTTIGPHAFKNCTELSSVIIPNSVTTIGGLAFGNCISLSSVIISDSVNIIGTLAFHNCRSLPSITIPNSVTIIGNGAFQDCSSLTSMIIPSSVVAIGASAFMDCTALASIIIPSSVTSIGSSAFWGTPYYDSLPDGLIYINDFFYRYKGIMPNNTSVTIRDGTVAISEGAFSGCTGLTSIQIPNTLSSIGDFAFQNCSGLTSIKLPDSLTRINSRAFMFCTGLTTIEIHHNITHIEDYAFRYCTSLDTVFYNATRCQFMGVAAFILISNAFSNCRNISTILIGDSVEIISSYAFYELNYLSSITIPKSVKKIAYSVFGNCVYLDTIHFNAVSCFTMGSSKYPAFQNCFRVSEILIGNEVKYIPNYAFLNCRAVKNLNIPDSVHTIGKNSFMDLNKLNSLTIGKSVRLINDSAFSNCMNLNNIYIKATTPPKTKTSTFTTVDKSIPVYVPCESIDAYKTSPYWSEFTNIKCDVDIEDTSYSKVEVKLYPNPSDGFAKLEVEGLSDEADVLVYNIAGGIVQEYKINQENNQLEFDLNGYAKGIYTIRVLNERINQTKKLVIQ